MTAEQEIKAEIIRGVTGEDGPWCTEEITVATVDAIYDRLCEEDLQWDAESEFRSSGESTGLECDWSRHYESDAVAKKLSTGKWVGWTYWYGGGKHGEPSAMDWMDEAYFLDVAEEEKLVTVRTFSKQAEAL